MVNYIAFAKMSGAGNDFVVIDNRQHQIIHADAAARALCDRRLGIGADGLLLVEKSRRTDFMMKYYNADGSYGGMCGNGGRCIAMFAFREHIVKGRMMTFEALDYHYRAEIGDGRVKLAMKDPVDFRLNKTLTVDGTTVRYHYVDTGTPHCVILMDENQGLFEAGLEEADITPLGRKLRYHEAFSPRGTNVNFVMVEPGMNRLVLRTYERGVEEETLACGTGSVASAVVASRFRKASAPVAVRVRSGEHLNISFADGGNEDVSEVTLEGSAKIVYEGTVIYETETDTIVG